MKEEKHQETLPRLPIIILHLILAALIGLALVILRGYLDGNITETIVWGFYAILWTVSLVYSLYATAQQKDS